MPKTRLLTEFGQGASLRRQDYTQAAKRALQDALWHNSINLAELFGKEKEAMLIDVEVGVQQPDQTRHRCTERASFPTVRSQSTPRRAASTSPAPTATRP